MFTDNVDHMDLTAPSLAALSAENRAKNMYRFLATTKSGKQLLAMLQLLLTQQAAATMPPQAKLTMHLKLVPNLIETWIQKETVRSVSFFVQRPCNDSSCCCCRRRLCIH
jgi:hypothetical protein